MSVKAEIERNVVSSASESPRGPSWGTGLGEEAGGQPSAKLLGVLQTRFGFDKFRPYQEQVCTVAASGQDVLLVMPTGAGKSLCYQLPGIARGGTTLVISPLIALMEDQVAKLKDGGFVAERIHSGRDRSSSRAVCGMYLRGELDFLFIAPERLRVPGFPELLSRCPPTLIAIDEAHCISQWGHDFRPDYRMLGERLPLLRPAPVIALTATATPAVQDDIVTQLKLTNVRRFIHGFRRDNLAVEVVERNPGDRISTVRGILRKAGRTPAIVYALTRKDAEEIANGLQDHWRAASYHAGLPTELRSQMQHAFVQGDLDVMVATTAFGMGIDKPNVRTVIHAGMPASLEGYYQEIGRAGRDGHPSRAILLHSFVDLKTHEFFFKRDYPEPDDIAEIYQCLDERRAISIAAAVEKTNRETEFVEAAVEKLWLHGGAVVAGDDEILRGSRHWRKLYTDQRNHKLSQIERMRAYARVASCRMLQLIWHFGDEKDGRKPCGHCDVCAPEASLAIEFRGPTEGEKQLAAAIHGILSRRTGIATGQIYRELTASAPLERRVFEHVLDSMARAGILRLKISEFVKGNETISFQRVYLSGEDSRLNETALRVKAPEREERVVREKRKARGNSGDAKVKWATPGPLADALRQWRLEEARRLGVPAFRILTDRVLARIAENQPRGEDELERIEGVGPVFVRKFGRALLELSRQH
jgi:DNA topoisomerase-3